MPHANDGQPEPGSANNTQKTAETILKKFSEAEKRHKLWRPQWEEIFEYALPNRLGFDGNPADDRVTGEIYDETVVVELPRFASRMVNGMFPPNLDAFKIVPGPEHPKPNEQGLQQQLDQLTKKLHTSLRTSSFHAELYEANHDLAIGTGNMLMMPGTFPGEFKFTSLPITQVAIMNGPDEKPGEWYRWRKVKLADIQKIWPQAKLNSTQQATLKANPGAETEVVMACIKQYSNDGVERGTVAIVDKGEKHVMLSSNYEGLGSLPFLSYRWSTSPGECYGRGPLLNVMPAVITANLVVELVLQNAQIAIGGIWTYDHDGVFNPDTIVLEPGTFIPKARGSEVQSLVSQQRFDVSQLVLDDMRRNIRAGLFAPGADRPQGRTPPSATEIADDNAQMAEAMGAVSGRLATELLYRIVQRGIWIYAQQGLIDRRMAPRVDGRMFEIVPLSPLLRAQQQHDINNLSRFYGQLSVLGPAGGLAIPPEKLIHHLGKLHNIPPHLLPSEAALKQQIAQMMEMAQQQQGG